MNPFKHLWRKMFPRRRSMTASDFALSDDRKERDQIEYRIGFLSVTIAIRSYKIAELRRKKLKRSHLVEANMVDRTEMLRLEKRLEELCA